MDPGAATYLDLISRVPVASQDELTLVELPVRERVFPLTDDAAQAGAGDDGGPGGDDDEASESESENEKKHKYPKRGRALLRASSTTEVPFLGLFSYGTWNYLCALSCRSV